MLHENLCQKSKAVCELASRGRETKKYEVFFFILLCNLVLSKTNNFRVCLSFNSFTF
ncbi:hypothetical protein Bca4012_062861 [Brassica carinata]